MDDLEQLANARAQLTSGMGIALKNRQEMMKKLSPEEKKEFIDFEKTYKKLMKSGNTAEANSLHMKMIEKHRK